MRLVDLCRLARNDDYLMYSSNAWWNEAGVDRGVGANLVEVLMLRLWERNGGASILYGNCATLPHPRSARAVPVDT